MRAPVVLVSLFVLAACASPPRSGIMAGQWTAASASERVPLSWESTGDTHGRIHATLGRGGERFHGKYVRVEGGHSKAEVQTVYNDWAAPNWATLDWNEEGNYPWNETVNVETWLHDYSGRVLATLLGDRNHSMRCQFTVTDPQAGLKSGGVGVCQVSDGSRIDVTF